MSVLRSALMGCNFWTSRQVLWLSRAEDPHSQAVVESASSAARAADSRVCCLPALSAASRAAGESGAMRSSMSPWRARISHGLWLAPLRATEFVGGAEELGCDLGAAVSADDGGGGLERVSAAPEIAEAGEQLDGFCDERGGVGELIPVVGDDPASFDVVRDPHRRAGRSQELVGFCGESLGLVEVRCPE